MHVNVWLFKNKRQNSFRCLNTKPFTTTFGTIFSTGKLFSKNTLRGKHSKHYTSRVSIYIKVTILLKSNTGNQIPSIDCESNHHQRTAYSANLTTEAKEQRESCRSNHDRIVHNRDIRRYQRHDL